MKETVVLGIGSRLMMDDGIGVYVVDALGRRNRNSSVKYIVGETDIDYCLSQIDVLSCLVIIDAAYMGEKPGTIRVMSLKEASAAINRDVFSHRFNLLEDFRLKEGIIEGIFIGIEPSEINYGINLSQALENLYFDIICQIEKIINSTQIILII